MPSTAAVRLFAIATLAILAPLHTASAHVTANPNEAAADSYFRTAFRVGHGCAGSPTVAVRIKIPDGAMSVRPQMKPGWKIEIKKRKLAKPIDAGHGNMVTETVDEVIWRGKLPDEYFDEFGLSMKLPASPQTTLYFPVVQECVKDVARWIEIPEAGKNWGDYDHPAPFVRLLEPNAAH